MQDPETETGVNSESSASLPYSPTPQPLNAPVVPPSMPLMNPQSPIGGAETPNTAHAAGNAGIIVLQWLTYALWGWTVLAVSFLTGCILAYFVNQASVSGIVPYSVAAVLVLLPISVACDVFYAKHEPPKKAGAASVVMIIHAVLFALLGIGSLIAAVFSLINIFVGNSSSSDWKTALYTALIIFILYLATFLRTLNPLKKPIFHRYYSIFMVVCVGIVAVLGIIGPVLGARKTRNDTLIENNLSTVQSDIDNYVSSNNRLPASLSAVHYDDADAQKLVSSNLVTYTPNTIQPSYTNSADISSSLLQSTPTYYYELCVTYTKAEGSPYSYNQPNDGSNGYNSYLDNSSHPAGNVCYKLDTSDY